MTMESVVKYMLKVKKNPHIDFYDLHEIRKKDPNDYIKETFCIPIIYKIWGNGLEDGDTIHLLHNASIDSFLKESFFKDNVS